MLDESITSRHDYGGIYGLADALLILMAVSQYVGEVAGLLHDAWRSCYGHCFLRHTQCRRVGNDDSSTIAES